MTDQERKTMSSLVDIIQGEINRMCVTEDLAELDRMTSHAKLDIERLQNMRYRADFRGDTDEKHQKTV